MNRLKIALICACVSVIGLAIGLPFAFNNSFNNDAGALAIYIVSKVVFGLVFIWASLIAVKNEQYNGVTGTIFTIGAALQFVPFFVRLIVSNGLASPHNIIWPIVMIVVLTNAFVFVSLGLTHTSKIMKESEEKSEDKEIAIHEEKVTSEKEGN